MYFLSDLFELNEGKCKNLASKP